MLAAAPVTNSPPPFAKGTLVKIDQFTRTLTLQTRHGERTFIWTGRSLLFLGKQRLTTDQLKPGDLVGLRHATDPAGRLVILRLKVYRDGQGRLPEPVPLPEQSSPAGASSAPPAAAISESAGAP